nr:methyl-accepting chemotaxis protein [Bacillus sp. FJAT-45350]
MKSLRYKLLIVVLPVLFIALVSVAFINHNKAKEFLEVEFNEKTEVSLEKARNDINNFFVQKIKEVEMMGNTDIILNLDIEEIVPYMQRENERLQDFEMFLVAGLDGIATSHAGTEANVLDRNYFSDVLEIKQTVLSEPIISRATEEMVVAIATPILNNGDVEGVLIATVPIEEIVQLVSEFRIGNEGYAFLVDDNGIVIAHPNRELIMDVSLLESSNSDIQTIVASSLNNETGSTTYNDNTINSFAYYTMIPSTSWGLVISAPVAEVTGNLSYLAMLSFVTAAIVLGFSVIVVIIFARRLIAPIQHLSDLTSKVASGDLTVQASASNSNDEVGVLSKNFDRMIFRIQELLGKIDSVSATVKESSDTLLLTSKETKEASEQVAITISELASGTTDIADSVTNATDRMNTMIGTVQQISTYTNEVVDTSTNSKVSAKKGLDAAQSALEKMEEVRQTVQDTTQTIMNLDQQSKEIGNIIQMITNIAEQTNLLALNASIEAARAGDHGRGFAVVADEVRKLATETSESADKISNLINDTQLESQRAVTSIKKGAKVVEEGTLTVHSASDAFTEIALYIDEVLEKNKSIYQSVRELEEVGSEIGSTMESISAVTQEASAGAEEVSATTEQQSAAANQIAYDAESLAELAEQLREVMSVFKTK